MTLEDLLSRCSANGTSEWFSANQAITTGITWPASLCRLLSAHSIPFISNVFRASPLMTLLYNKKGAVQLILLLLTQKQSEDSYDGAHKRF